MRLQERKLYHQIHPLKLFTDISVTPIFLYLLWRHHPYLAVCAGFIPPVLVSAWMIKWPPHLERIRDSKRGEYLRKYMTPAVEAIRLLSLVPMAYGAWLHKIGPIWLGLVMVCIAWANGLLLPRRQPGNE